jgi:uncharacterized protein YxeA
MKKILTIILIILLVSCHRSGDTSFIERDEFKEYTYYIQTQYKLGLVEEWIESVKQENYEEGTEEIMYMRTYSNKIVLKVHPPWPEMKSEEGLDTDQ